MIGTKVERQGIIRAGAKMIAAVSEATVPKISVIVRKAYGAGLYAMCGPAFEPDGCLALPTASIAVMGAEAAVNAVFFNKIQAISDTRWSARSHPREARGESADIDISISHRSGGRRGDRTDSLRGELIRRFGYAEGRGREFSAKRNPITPA